MSPRSQIKARHRQVAKSWKPSQPRCTGESHPMSDDLLIAFDGSWAKDTYGPSTDDTNVGAAARAWKDTVWYQEGVGSRHGLIGKFLGGVFGFGLFARVRELENNILMWKGRNPDAKVYGIGWSRGAVGLIILANRLAGRGVLFESLRLLDPVPGPFKHKSWELQNPGVPIAMLYTHKPAPFYQPVKLEGENVKSCQAIGADHTGVGRDPRWLKAIDHLLTEL